MRGAVLQYPPKQKSGPEPAVFYLALPGCPGGAKALHPGLKSLLRLLGLLRLLRLFRLLRFLSHSILSGFNGLKRDTEACLAEGQPRNILEHNPNRFAARCRVLSRRCHHVIHSCYAFEMLFRENFAASPPARASRQG
jgi:hypothetical protein